ncbi:hypothetical protein [Bdellovibrio sp. HCB337]|uniref:hypothetical protein n=1 Tax=Bdellovibrio sp. HCB337 TaxID=3394358 RepID=UPI0039A40943
MSFLRKSMLYAVVSVLVWAFSAQTAFARGGGGGHSMEFGLALLSAGQNDIDTMITNARANNSASTSDMGSAYELFAQYQYRFGGTMFSILFRPSYVMQSATGSGTGGSYDYKLSGFTIFPMFRMYPLENDFIRFFMQTGLGYGKLSADITEGTSSIAFSGGNFGAIGGLGVDFCFTDSHCVTIEGNLRYLPIERNKVSSVTGTPGLSQYGNGQEAEINGSDLMTSLSGIQGIIAYTLNF